MPPTNSFLSATFRSDLLSDSVNTTLSLSILLLGAPLLRPFLILFHIIDKLTITRQKYAMLYLEKSVVFCYYNNLGMLSNKYDIFVVLRLVSNRAS